MRDFPEHPEIAKALRNGYAYDVDDFDQDEYEAYCDRLCDERREAAILGE